LPFSATQQSCDEAESGTIEHFAAGDSRLAQKSMNSGLRHGFACGPKGLLKCSITTENYSRIIVANGPSTILVWLIGKSRLLSSGMQWRFTSLNGMFREIAMDGAFFNRPCSRFGIGAGTLQ